MEKRKDKRFKKRELIRIDNKAGMLLDISEDGLKVALSSLPTQRKISIRLHLGDKEFSLNGTIRWIKKTFSAQGANELGIRIDNPPADYSHALSKIFGPSVLI